MTRPRTAPLILLYGLSGAAGLAWQVLQVRAFVPVFGAGAEAIAAVTACFLGGLGLGGALARPLLRRMPPLRLYGVLEIAAGLLGAALPWALHAGGPLLVDVLRSTEGPGAATAVRLGAAALLVGPMATALGATFPAVASALDADQNPDRVGLAYGTNAVGAAAGALAAGLWMPWALGVTWGAAALGSLNLAVGLVALLWSRGGTAPEQSAAPLDAAAASEKPVPALLWGLAAATGATGMGLELSWSRVSGPLLAARSGSDAVAFSVVLAAVVLGIGLGGVFARRTKDGLGLPLFVAQGALALATLLVLEPVRGLLLGARHLEIFEGLLPIVPALCLGATFPLLSNALAEAGTPASRGLGRLYAVNTLGAVAGSLGTGFVLQPLLGAQRLLVLLAGCSLGVALLALGRSRGPRTAGLAGVPAALLVAGFFVWTPPVAGERLIPPFEVVHAAVEGRNGSTLVSGRAEAGDRALTSSGHRIGAANRTGPVNDHELRAQGPASLHPAPRDVLLIGLGTGATAEAFLRLPTVSSLTVVELDGNMVELLSHFGTEGILSDPRLSLAVADGRWWLRASDQRFDVIAVDAYDPRTASAAFYTREFYASAADHLREDGLLFVKFNPATVTEPGPLASYLATLWSVFDQGGLVYVQRGLFGLVGTADRSRLTLPDSKVVADARSSTALVGTPRLHTDDRPVRLVDRPGPQFALLQPYWEARHGDTEPPWTSRAGRRPGPPPGGLPSPPPGR